MGRAVLCAMALVSLAGAACGTGAATSALMSCPSVTADDLGAVVAAAMDSVANDTAEDGWGRACAEVRTLDGSTFTVTIKVAWEGTAHAFASKPGANPVEGLGDEAYAFDAGHQIALRSGELVAVVASGPTDGSPELLEAVARQVADLIRDCNQGRC